MSLEKLRTINENAKKAGKDKPRPNDGLTHLGKGVNMDDISKVVDISISDADRSGHLGCFGTTRVGKTRLIENIIEQDIRKGYNVVVIDPKGDGELFSKIVQVAAESGRLDDVMMLTPIFPDVSIMLDPLAYYYMEDELVEHIISGIKAKEDYFIAIAQEVSQAVIAGLALEARCSQEEIEHQLSGCEEPKQLAGAQSFPRHTTAFTRQRGSYREHEPDTWVPAGLFCKGIIIAPDDTFRPDNRINGTDHRQKYGQ